MDYKQSVTRLQLIDAIAVLHAIDDRPSQMQNIINKPKQVRSKRAKRVKPNSCQGGTQSP